MLLSWQRGLAEVKDSEMGRCFWIIWRALSHRGPCKREARRSNEKVGGKMME